MGPAPQAVIAELVSPPQLSPGVSLNSMGLNLARGVGPAIGGIVLAKTGAGKTFLLNSLPFLAVVLVLVVGDRPVGSQCLRPSDLWAPSAEVSGMFAMPPASNRYF